MKMSAPPQIPPAGTGVAATQVAALCWRMHKGEVEVLLITSRETGRWVIPKGWPVAGLTQAVAAAREAWEEAGVQGVVAETPMGEYLYDKMLRPKSAQRCAVAVFGLKVKAVKDRFPEAKQRRRAWFSALAAAELVAEPDLAALFGLIAENPALLESQNSLPSA